MKTEQHHFVLKEDGKIYWIEKMPHDLMWQNASIDYNTALQLAIDNAVEVSNQEEVEKALCDRVIVLVTNFVYSLQCSVEIRTVQRHPNPELWTRVAIVSFQPPVKTMKTEHLRITLCGSTKFKKEFEAINRQLSLEGHIVYSVAFFSHADGIPLTFEEKSKLDLVHKMKIDNSDGILVIDVDGYIGESTRNEIEYAKLQGKFIIYLSQFTDISTVIL